MRNHVFYRLGWTVTFCSCFEITSWIHDETKRNDLLLFKKFWLQLESFFFENLKLEWCVLITFCTIVSTVVLRQGLNRDSGNTTTCLHSYMNNFLSGQSVWKERDYIIDCLFTKCRSLPFLVMRNHTNELDPILCDAYGISLFYNAHHT